MIQTYTISEFAGGVSAADKQGPRGSFRYSRSLDFRTNPNRISVLPHMDPIGVGVVDGLIQEIVQVPNGSRFALDENGGFYSINNSNVVTRAGDVKNGAHGMVYRSDIDRLIITSSDSASSYYPVSGVPTAPALQVQKYGPSASADSLANRTGGGSAYTVPLAIDEVKGACPFQPDIEPGYSNRVFVIVPGTGDWTLTLHDDANNVLTTTTITNANLVANSLNEFLYSSAIRMLVKPNARTYHFHLTSTVADGSVAVGTSNDLTTANFEFWAARFVVPNNGIHTAIHFLQYVCITNERYLTVWEPLEDTPTNQEWQRHRLVFPPGYEGCGLATWRNYLAIACEKRSNTNTREFQEGRIFLWNGTSATYDDFIDVPEGSPAGLTSSQGILYWIAAHTLWGYSGADPVDLKRFPNTNPDFSGSDDFTYVNPHMMANRRKTLHVGYPTQTTNANIEHGIYTWGRPDKDYGNSLGYSFILSNGQRFNNGSNNLRLGCVKSFGNILMQSWRNDGNTSSASTYGLDATDNSTDPSNDAVYESLVFDNGEGWRRKIGMAIFATFLPLPASGTLTLKYKLDRGSWQYPENATNSTQGSTSLVCRVDQPFFEIELGVEFGGAISDTIEATTLNLQFENNRPLRLHGKLVGGTDQEVILI